MSTELETALAERDTAIKGNMDKLEEKQLLLDDRLFSIEQNDPSFYINDNVKPVYNLSKVMLALSDPRNHKLDGFEAEWDQELSRKSGISRPNAIQIPLNVKEVQYGPNSPDLGGHELVETQLHSELIDVLREESLILGLDPTVITATGDLDIPKKSAGSTAYWFGGDGDDTITESTPIFTALQQRPKFCAGLTKVSYKMMLQTGGGIEGILRRDLMATIAEAVDQAALQGTGSSSQPTGVINTSGILTDLWTDSPATLTWDDVLEMERLMITNKSLKGNLVALTDAATFKSSKQTVKVSGDSAFLTDPNGLMNGYPLKPTTFMPANKILFGNWNELIVTTWGSISLEVDQSSNFSSGSTVFRAILPIDFGVRHAESFVLSSLS